MVNGPTPMSRPYSNEDSPNTMAEDSLDYDDDDDDDRSGRGGESHKRTKAPDEPSDEDSKWIHRDKLAKIENEELQAAGFVLPQPRDRSRSRPRRERSQSSTRRIGADTTRSRKNSSHALEPRILEPYAAMAEGDDVDGETIARPLTGSRIPVPKKATLSQSTNRTRDNSPEDQDKQIDAPKTRPRSNSTALRSLDPSPTLKAQPVKRSVTDVSPKKPTPTAARKASAPSKSIPPEARGKVKPKGKNNGSSTRPSTRSGERELSTGSLGSKPMEGEPPWMISAYKPDPRLPPDQQLLPTVAKRLQQEKWEQEGKFGSIYDKDFRPLTDEGFLSPPSVMPTSSNDNIINQEIDKPDEWPFKSPEAPKSPASIGRSSTYSTMPKIQDKPATSPLQSPKPPAQQPMAPQPIQITRVPDVSEKEEETAAKKKDGGCACCIVM